MAKLGFRMNYGHVVRKILRVQEGLEGGFIAQDLARFAEHRVFSDSQQSFVRQADPTTGAAWKPSVRAKLQHGQTLMDKGRLRRSVRAMSQVTGRRIIVRAGTLPLAYAAIHQFGGTTSPHVIVPRRAHALRWMAGGDPVFASRVNHPGSKIPARPYVGMTPGSIGAVRQHAQDVIARELGR